MVTLLLKITKKRKSVVSPEAHVDGQYFHQIVCSELVRIIWVIWPLNTHHSTKFLNLFSSTSSKIILYRLKLKTSFHLVVVWQATSKENSLLS